MRDRTGLLCIGDPHLSSRVPGFRSDDYPRTILSKLDWCLEYARRERLLPVVLGDWFHYPRDNANWLLAELLTRLDTDVLTVYGNHDFAENALGPDDSLGVLAAARRVVVLSEESPWRGTLGGVCAVVGGTSYRDELPLAFDRTGAEFVAWITHHDIRFDGYDRGIAPTEIDGIDVVINGHIHRPYDAITAGSTRWMNPGNIARIKRGDISRRRAPQALRIDVGRDGWRAHPVDVPHAPFDDVFHPIEEARDAEPERSAFVRGLAELEALKTESGAGLRSFLDDNLGQFEAAVADEIRSLAGEVIDDDPTHDD